MNNREIICIHVGQAGIQIGNAVWELFSVEHELDYDGYQICYCPWPLVDNTNSLYYEVGSGKFIPRSLMVDSESLVIEEVKCGSWNKMFDNRSLICGKEDASTIFAKGYKSCANDVLNECLTYLRILLEESSYLNGFLLFHSLGGGTGSGLTSRIVDAIQSETHKKPMIHLSIVPPMNKTGFIVEPYNGVLSTAALIESSSIMCMMENEALYKNVELLTKLNKLSYININRHFAQITSSLTTSYRFSNKLSSDFSVFQTNLVPFPEIHFPIASYAQSNESSDTNLIHMTRSGFSKDYMVLNLEPNLGSFMSCCLLYRGMNCAPMTINKALQAIKSDNKNKFVDWSPTSFKISINVQMPGFIPCANIPETKQSLCVLSNSTAIIQIWIKLLHNFQNLFSRRSFIHWFQAEGVDEDIFKEAEERIVDLISKYQDLETDKDISYLNKHKSSRDIPNFLKKMNCDSQIKVQVPKRASTKPATTNLGNTTETTETSTTQRKETGKSKITSENISKTESSSVEISTTNDQHNKSCKYQSLCTIKPSDSTDDSYSKTDSMFMKSQNYPTQSSETINALQTPKLFHPIRLKSRPFSEILRQSILEYPHGKSPSSNNLCKPKHFLSQFFRLSSQIIGSKSESECNIDNHSCLLNYSVNRLEYGHILYARLKDNLHIFKETLDFPEIHYCISEEKKQPAITIPLVSQFIVRVIDPLKTSRSVDIHDHTLVSSNREISEISCQTNVKNSLSRRLSQLFYRKSTSSVPKKSKFNFYKRQVVGKNLRQTKHTSKVPIVKVSSSTIDLSTQW